MSSVILRVTTGYKHLGNYPTIATILSHEAHYNAAQAKQTLTDTLTKARHGLKTPKILSVLDALVASCCTGRKRGPQPYHHNSRP